MTQTAEYWREYNQRPEVKERNRLRAARARAADPEIVRERHRRWKEAHPERMAAAKRRYREKMGGDPSFRAEAAERTRRWREENPDREREHSRRKRAIRAGVAHEPYRRVDIIARDGGICYLCELPVPVGAEHLDHVIPISRGGPDTAANVRVTHALCNLRKHARLPK